MKLNLIAISLVALVLLALWLLRRTLRRGQTVPTPFDDMPVRQVSVSEWTFRYHQSGRGPHMVLIHGIGANLFCWRFLLSHLTPHYTVLALDLPGFGQSSKRPDATYGLDEQVQRVQLLLDQLKIAQAYIVGNSMGGNIALWFALQNPKRTLGTVVIAPATSPKLVPLDATRWLWMSKPLAQVIGRGAIGWAHRRTVTNKTLVGLDRVEETFKTYGQNADAVRSFLLATEAIRDPRLSKSLARLKSRVLILWGSRDKLVSRAVIDQLERQLENHESHVHLGGGHHLQEDEPIWVAEKIDAFFSTSPD